MTNSKLETQNFELNFLEILSNFSHQKIAVIGDLILDKYIFGKVDRISPEAPVPIVQVESESYIPGGAANVAANIVSLGGKAFLFGITGNDPYRHILLEKINSCGINGDGIFADPHRHTIRKTRILGLNQQLLRLDHENNFYINNRLQNLVVSGMQSCAVPDAIIVSDYAKGTITRSMLRRIKEFCQLNNSLLFIDPKPVHKVFYKGAYLITPNKKEAQEMSGITIKTEADFQKAGKKLMKELEANIIITAGAEGMYVFENGKRDKVKGLRGKEASSNLNHSTQLTTQPTSITHLPTQAREVYDVSGAGDTVVATLALAICAGASILQAAELANIAAGIKVGKSGTKPVYLQELQPEI